jgi:two-component system, LytTR family, response regulator
MKIMVVDDESLAISRLSRMLGELGYSDIVSCGDPLEALNIAMGGGFDLFFLDISMPMMSGLELANRILHIHPRSFIVFQTAYGGHALEAYRSGGIDYLLKPVEKAQLQKTLDKVKGYMTTPNHSGKKLLGKSGNSIYLVEPDDIYYIRADLDEVIVRIKETDIYLKRKIGDLEELLRGKNFFRIHRSIIVNVDRIKSMESVEQSKLRISFVGIDSVVTSSKDGAKEFREYLEQRSL